MSDSFQGFDARLKRIDRKHAKLANGYTARVSRDGLIIFRPKRRKPSISLRGIALLIVGFLCFKGIVMAHLGGTVYEDRLAALKEGTIVEQAGAFVMQGDPVTVYVAEKLRPFLR